MRLHRLRIQAFGPFAGTEAIDFDALTEAGLHLIHGPTGAGKTSILDAVCFALFSGVPGSRMQGRETLHSDHAAPTTRPEVELEFSVGGRRLRVRRSPEHQVAKKRGTGTRSQRGSVGLEELRDGVWTTVSTRSDEVGQVIGDVLGMGLPQFAQVMLLPQGEFTAFLRAKPDDRGRLLERIFDISDFTAIEQWLTDHRKSLEADVVQSDAHRAALLARAQDLLGAIPDPQQDDRPSLPELGPADADDVLRTFVDRLSEQLTALLGEADTAHARLDELRTRLADERALAALQSQARSAQETLDRLEAEAESVTEAEEALDCAIRADACRPARIAVRRRGDEHRAARSAARDARTDLATHTAWQIPEMHDAAPWQDTTLQPLHERATAGTEALAGRPELLRQTRALEQELQAAETTRQRVTDDATRSAAALAAVRQQTAEVMTRRDRQLEIAATDLQWRDLLARLETALGATDAAVADLDHAAEADRQHRSAQHEWTAAEGEAVRLRTARLAGIAAELAGELSEGTPCLVCGSIEHPEPAVPEQDQVDAAQVDAAENDARSALRRSEQTASRRSSAIGRAEARCRQLLVALEPFAADTDPDQSRADEVGAAEGSLRRAVADRLPAVVELADSLTTDTPAIDPGRVQTLHELSDTLTHARDSGRGHGVRAAAAAEQVDALDTQLETLRARQDDADQQATSLAEASRAAESRVAALHEQLSTTRGRLDELTRNHRTVCGCAVDDDHGDTSRAHARAMNLLEHLTLAATTERTAAAELSAAQDELDRVLADQGFADALGVDRASLTAAEQQRLRALIDTARTDRDKAIGVLEQPEVTAAIGAPAAIVDEVAAEVSAAERSARHTQEAVGDVRRTLQSLERIARDLHAHDAASLPLRERLAVATSLASAATGSGDNVMRMRLTAYVLAARLETVTELANARLQVMTAGRFQLEHTDQRAARGSRSGLGLQVRDAWTGTTRDTATLSGGESFIASLALALGLGEAVLEAAGGRRLETLLVDEGFGSLDEDSLEQVLDVLDGLRAGGRTVGIVSHVPELRSRIPAQIRVSKTTSGSTLEVVTADVA